MKFSIIVPVYNVSEYLEVCINSVLKQSFSDYEIIIINDGSTDNSGQIADEFSYNNEHVKVFHQANGGASKARNNGIKNANGEYLLFLDGDDFWSDENFLRGLNEEIETSLADVILFGYSYYYSVEKIRTIKFPKEDKLLDAVKLGVFSGPNVNKCVSRKLFQEGLKFPEDLLSEDTFYCSEILKRLSSFSILESSQYMYRQNRPGSITNVVKEKNVLDILKSIDIGLRDQTSYSETIQQALNIYFSINYISILPYVAPYRSNQEIEHLLKKYKYLLKYANKVNNLEFRLTGIFTSVFGINMSTKFFAYLLKFYKKYR